MMRFVVFALSAVGLFTAPMPAFADVRGAQIAYDYAMRCFVAGGLLVSDLNRHGGSADEIATAKRYSRKAFDSAYSMGAKLGYSNKRISADMDAFQRTELRRITLENDYRASTRADCAQLDLMPTLE